VRDQRATAVFWTMSPMWIGRRSFTRSHVARPRSVFFHWKKPMKPAIDPGTQMNQQFLRKSENVTIAWVNFGRSEDSPGWSATASLKASAKIGTMKMTTATMISIATAKTKAGYMMAERIWRFRASSFSSWKAIRSSASSSRPELSPERTIARKRPSKIWGRLPIASASELPASTSWRMPAMASQSRSSSV
jgi:hypothetical protein